jgi:hypothetical protein
MAEPQVTMEVAKGLAAGIAFERTSSFRPSLPADVEAALTRLEAGLTEESLKMLAGEICPYTKEDVTGVVKENLSSQERDLDTGQKKEPKPGTPERSRYEVTLDMAETLRVYLESGGQFLPERLINAIVTCLRTSPLYEDYFKNGGDGKTTAENFLKQPEVRKAILRLFTERLDPKKRLEHEEVVRTLQTQIAQLEAQLRSLPEPVTPDEIREAEEEFQTAKSELIRATALKERLRALQAAAKDDARLRPLCERKMRSLSHVLSDIHRLQQLEDQLRITTNATQRQNLERQIQDIKSKPDYNEYLSLQSQLNEIEQRQGEIEALSELITEAEMKYNEAQAKLKELRERQKDTQTSKRRAELEAEIFDLRQKLQEAQALLTAERIKYASEIMAIPAEAVKEFLDGTLDKAAKHYKEEAAKSAQEKEAEKQKLEQEALRKIGEGLGTKKKKIKINGKETTVAVPDKKSASELMGLLMQPNGLVEFGKKIVAELYDINTNTDPPTYSFKTKNIYGLTEAEADLIKDKLGTYDYLKTTGLSLAKAVMANYFLAGGRLNQDMVYALLNSEVGSSLIDDGKKLAKERRDVLKGMVGEDILTKFEEIKQGKGVEWLKANWWKFGIGIIAILLLLGLGLKVKG